VAQNTNASADNTVHTDDLQTKPVFPFWLIVHSRCELVKEFSDLVCSSCLHGIHKIIAQNTGPQFTNCCGLDFVGVNKNELLQHGPIISQRNDVKWADVRVYLLHDLLDLRRDHQNKRFVFQRLPEPNRACLVGVYAVTLDPLLSLYGIIYVTWYTRLLPKATRVRFQ